MEAYSLILRFLAWFVASQLVMAVAEYVLHRWIMHRPFLGKFLHSRWFYAVYDEHTLQHHALNRTDLNIDLPFWHGWALGAVVWVPMLFFDWTASLAIVLTTTFHAYAWTRIHRAIHGLEDGWFVRVWPFYGMAKRHHEDHHRRVGRNYGAVYPWTDFLFGTYWRSTTESRRSDWRRAAERATEWVTESHLTGNVS